MENMPELASRQHTNHNFLCKNNVVYRIRLARAGHGSTKTDRLSSKIKPDVKLHTKTITEVKLQSDHYFQELDHIISFYYSTLEVLL